MLAKIISHLRRFHLIRKKCIFVFPNCDCDNSEWHLRWNHFKSLGQTHERFPLIFSCLCICRTHMVVNQNLDTEQKIPNRPYINIIQPIGYWTLWLSLLGSVLRILLSNKYTAFILHLSILGSMLSILHKHDRLQFAIVPFRVSHKLCLH